MAARLSSLAAAVVLGGLVGVAIDSRSGAAAQTPDTMTALLEEVRGLRAAMEQLASAGPRTQLLFGRLQIQEQRVNGLVRRLDTLRDQMRSLTQEHEQATREVARYEEIARSSTADANERTAVQNAIPRFKQQIARLTTELQGLQAQEASLLSEIATEQGRWTEINRSLDELERALIRR